MPASCCKTFKFYVRTTFILVNSISAASAANSKSVYFFGSVSLSESWEETKNSVCVSLTLG